jgi:hypothetical protein
MTDSAAPSKGVAMSETLTAGGNDTASSGRVIAKHPNASVALGSGSGLGALVVWLVGLSGTAMPAEVGAAIGGSVAAVALFIGRRGIKGVIHALWQGDQVPAEAPS